MHGPMESVCELFNPQGWLASNFSQQYNSYIIQQGHGNKENNNQLYIILIEKQILLVSTLGNV